MRSVVCLLSLLAFTWQSRVLAQNDVDTSAMEALSSCVVQCSNQVLAGYNCTAEQSCFCDNNQLQTDLQDCFVSSGCSFADQLAAKKFQTSTCDTPVRNRGPLLAIVTYTLFGVAAVFTIGRCLSRWSQLDGSGYSWDDLVAVVCLAPLAVLTAAIYYAVHYGEGKDIWGLTASDVENVAMWVYICTIMYTFVIFGTKISLVLLYLRFWHARDTFRILCYITLGLLGTAYIAFQITSIAQCHPISSQWRRFVDPTTHGTCIDRQAWVWAFAGFELGFDVLVILLPIPKLLESKLSKTRKLGMSWAFLVGLAVLAMDIVRMFYIHGLTTKFNITHYSSYLGLYTNISAILSQMACCMPSTVRLVRNSWRMTTGGSVTGSKRRGSSEPGTPFRSASREPTIDSTAIFDGAAGAPQDTEKGVVEEDDQFQTFDQVKASGEYSSTNESADSPIVQRTSHNSHQMRQQRSFEASWRQRPSNRNTSGTNVTGNSNNSNNGSWRLPDILYHDRENQVRLEIHDPPREPVKATLTYLDKFDGKHNVELQGRPTTSHHDSKSKSKRPSQSRSPSDSSTRPSTSPDSRMSDHDNDNDNEISFIGRNNLQLGADLHNLANTIIREQRSSNRIDQLLKAHKALTEGSRPEDVRASLGMVSKTSRESRISRISTTQKEDGDGEDVVEIRRDS